MREQLLRLAPVDPYPVQGIEVGLSVAFRDKEYRLAVDRPGDIRDVDVTRYVRLRVAIEVGDMQLVVGRPVEILIDFTRYLQQVGDTVRGGTHAHGRHLLQRADVFQRHRRRMDGRDNGDQDHERGQRTNPFHTYISV